MNDVPTQPAPSPADESPQSSPAADDLRDWRPPEGTGTFGMILIIAALGMLFLATILAYIAIRTQWINPDRPPTPPLGTLHLPTVLWFSTFVILVSSVTLQWALMAVRNDRLVTFRRAMVLTLLLSIGFLVLQVPGLYALIAEHRVMLEQDVRLYAMMGLLLVIHAAHVVGGLIPMVQTTVNATRHRYTPEHHQPVKYLTMYWHFIDGVWLIMFNVMLILG